METYSSSRVSLVTYDEGLRAFMISVYNRLGLGVLITAAIAWFAGNTALGEAFYHIGAKGKPVYTALGYAVVFGPIVLILLMGFLFKATTSRAGSAFLYYATTALFGLSTGILFKIYTGQSMGLALAVTASIFGGMSLWGYTTKRNLSGWGNFLVGILFGAIVAMILSIFVPGLNLIISGACILLFSAFIAFDTQNMKNTYAELRGADGDDLAAAANMAALNMYLNVLNLFQSLLPFLGDRK